MSKAGMHLNLMCVTTGVPSFVVSGPGPAVSTSQEPPAFSFIKLQRDSGCSQFTRQNLYKVLRTSCAEIWVRSTEKQIFLNFFTGPQVDGWGLPFTLLTPEYRDRFVDVVPWEQPHLWLIWGFCSALSSGALIFYPYCHWAVGKHCVLPWFSYYFHQPISIL